MKVAIFSTKYYERELLSRFNVGDKHMFTFFDIPLQMVTSHMAAGFDAVCVLANDVLTKDTIEQLAVLGIRLIDLRCAGFDNVDLKAAHQKDIKVMRVPAYSPEAIAEHAVSLILTLNRKTHKAYNRVRENNFSLQGLMGFNLHGKTIGIVGTGKIGRAFAAIMLGFGCTVIAYDPTPNEAIEKQGVSYKTFDKLLQESDVISIHCPLYAGTHHLFNKSSFSKMRKGAMLINTGRGGIINTVDAIAALKSGELGYLGIDVYEGEEKLFYKDLSDIIIQDDLIERLMSFKNVLLTPHQGYFTKEAVEEIAKTTIRNFTAFEQGDYLVNEIKSTEM